MKSVIMFAAASLVLVVGIIAIALPSPVQANPNFQWCYDAGIHCYDNKGQCQKALLGAALNTCHKEYLIH